MKSKLITATVIICMLSCTNNKTKDQVYDTSIVTEKEIAASDGVTGSAYNSSDQKEIAASDGAEGSTFYSSDQNSIGSGLVQQAPKQQPGKQLQTRQDTSITIRPSATNIDWDKKIIKTATLKLEVTDFDSFATLANQAMKRHGGYIASEHNDLSDVKKEATVSIKVPVARFEELMTGLNIKGSKLLEKNITTEDVTSEVVDTRSRLEAKKEQRSKYLEFLRQSKNMKEVLEVQREINEIQEQIESATGRVGYLNHQALYSTINLTFYQPLAGYQSTEPEPSFFKRVAFAFQSGANIIVNMFVGLLYVWPFILSIFIIFFLFRKRKLTTPHLQ